jgi:AcrR family transcriptional regulator
VSIAGVAARSGVHPTSIYRRRGTPEALVLDVAAARLEADLPMPDTGTLRGDLLAYAAQAAEDLSRPDGLAFLHALLTARTDRESAALPSYLKSRAAQIQNMLDRARQRAEPELHATDVVDGVLGPIYMRTLFAIGGSTGPTSQPWSTGRSPLPSGCQKPPPHQRQRRPPRRSIRHHKSRLLLPREYSGHHRRAHPTWRTGAMPVAAGQMAVLVWATARRLGAAAGAPIGYWSPGAGTWPSGWGSTSSTPTGIGCANPFTSNRRIHRDRRRCRRTVRRCVAGKSSAG